MYVMGRLFEFLSGWLTKIPLIVFFCCFLYLKFIYFEFLIFILFCLTFSIHFWFYIFRVGDVLISVNGKYVDGGTMSEARNALIAAGMQARMVSVDTTL